MADTKITKEQVNHIASLAQIPLKEGEDEKFSRYFSETLDYINILNELDTGNVDETYQVTGLKNIFQEGDENESTLSQKEALSNAKETKDNLIITEAVFDR